MRRGIGYSRGTASAAAAPTETNSFGKQMQGLYAKVQQSIAEKIGSARNSDNEAWQEREIPPRQPVGNVYHRPAQQASSSPMQRPAAHVQAPVQSAEPPRFAQVQCPYAAAAQETATVYVDCISSLADCARVAAALRMERKKIVSVYLNAPTYSGLISYLNVLYGACISMQYRMFQTNPNSNSLTLVSRTSTVEMAPGLQRNREHTDMIGRFDEVVAQMVRLALEAGENVDESLLHRTPVAPQQTAFAQATVPQQVAYAQAAASRQPVQTAAAPVSTAASYAMPMQNRPAPAYQMETFVFNPDAESAPQTAAQQRPTRRERPVHTSVDVRDLGGQLYPDAPSYYPTAMPGAAARR